MGWEYGYTDIPYNNRKNIYLSDKFLSHFMFKFHKITLRGDSIYNLLAFFLVKLLRTKSTKLNLFLFIVIGVRPVTHPLP